MGFSLLWVCTIFIGKLKILPDDVLSKKVRGDDTLSPETIAILSKFRTGSNSIGK